MARGVQTGRMWVNTSNELPAHTPFGGFHRILRDRPRNAKAMLAHYSQTRYNYVSMAEGCEASTGVSIRMTRKAPRSPSGL